MTVAMAMSFCAGCESAILDKFLLKVLDRSWHVGCVRCVVCGVAMETKCFSRDGKLFCREDFFRHYGVKCGGCSRGISSRDLVRRTRNCVYHVTCFTCAVCKRQPKTGEELYLINDHHDHQDHQDHLFLCRDDFLLSTTNTTTIRASQIPLISEAGKIVSKQRMTEVESLMVDETTSPDDTTTASVPSPFSSDSLQTPSPSSLLFHRLQPPPPSTSSSSVFPRHQFFPGPCQLVTPRSIRSRMTTCCSLERNGAASQMDTVLALSRLQQQQQQQQQPMTTTTGRCSSRREALPHPPPPGMTCIDPEVRVSTGSSDPVGGTKKRGPRTTIKAKQLEALRAAFVHSPKPSRHVREKLATETQLSMRVIQVWFQNRRSKERRMRQMNSGGGVHPSIRRPPFYRGQRRPTTATATPDPQRLLLLTPSPWEKPGLGKLDGRREGKRGCQFLKKYIRGDEGRCMSMDSVPDSLSSSSEIHPLLSQHPISAFSPPTAEPPIDGFSPQFNAPSRPVTQSSPHQQ